MTDPDWTSWPALAAIGQLAAAVVAFLGLGFVGVQIRAARKTADFQNLQEFDRRAAEREHALLRAETEVTKKQALYEFANFLEMHAAALNDGLLPKTSRKIIREKLIDSIAVITEEPSTHQTLFDGVTSPTTFAVGKVHAPRKARDRCLSQSPRGASFSHLIADISASEIPADAVPGVEVLLNEARTKGLGSSPWPPNLSDPPTSIERRCAVNRLRPLAEL